MPLHAEPAREPRTERASDDSARRMLEEKEAELARLREELSDLHGKLDEQVSKAGRAGYERSTGSGASAA